MKRLALRWGLGLVALIPFMACMAVFTDLDFWPSVAVYAAVGLYAGATSILDRELS